MNNLALASGMNHQLRQSQFNNIKCTTVGFAKNIYIQFYFGPEVVPTHSSLFSIKIKHKKFDTKLIK